MSRLASTRDGAGERTEPPTPRRLQRARQAGDVPRSAELRATLAVGGQLLAVGLLAGPTLRALDRMLAAGLAGRPLSATAWAVAGWSGALLGGVWLASVGAGAVQGGVGFRPSAWKPLLGRLTGRNDRPAWLRGLAATIKLALVLGVLLATLRGGFADLPGLAAEGAATLPGRLGGLLTSLAVRLGVVLLLLGVGDYALARHRWRARLAMTKRQVRDDHKQDAGGRHACARSGDRTTTLAVDRTASK